MREICTSWFDRKKGEKEITLYELERGRGNKESEKKSLSGTDADEGETEKRKSPLEERIK